MIGGSDECLGGSVGFGRTVKASSRWRWWFLRAVSEHHEWFCLQGCVDAKFWGLVVGVL